MSVMIESVSLSTGVSLSVDTGVRATHRSRASNANRLIGAAAAALIPDGSSVFIDSGTTTAYAACALASHRSLLVMTNNLNIAVHLSKLSTMRVVVVGGAVRGDDQSVARGWVVEAIRGYRFDFALIDADAMDEDGSLLAVDADKNEVTRAIFANSRRVILACDHTRWDLTAPARIGHIAEVDTFVTDRLASRSQRDLCHRNRVRLIETESDVYTKSTGS